jgi:Bacterial type II/III secretion system short domain
LFVFSEVDEPSLRIVEAEDFSVHFRLSSRMKLRFHQMQPDLGKIMSRKILCSCVCLMACSSDLREVAAQIRPAVAETWARLPERPSPSASQVTLQFSFRDAAWDRVLQWLADKANLSLDLTDVPPGSFNYIDDRKHSLAEAMDAINGYLLPRGYVTLRRNQFLVVLKTDNPILPNLIPTVPHSQLDQYGNNELLRIILPVEGFKPSEVAEQVQQFLGTFGKATPVDASHSVLLQGFGKSLRIAVAILSSAVAPVREDELTFRSFPLNHIPAADAERQIQKLFGLGTNPYTASLARRESYYQRRREDEKRSEQPQSPTPLMQHLSMNMKVSSLARTNSLLVAATPAAVKLVESILTSIDVRPAGGEVEFVDDSTAVLKIYIVNDADEDDVAETINAIMPGVVINEDGRQDSIHVYATAREHKEVEKLIKIIDQGGTEGGVEVFRLYRSEPFAMSELLASLFENQNRDDRPVITPEPRSQSLLIRAKGQQMDEIKKALAAYGETGLGRGQTALTSPVTSRFRKLSVPNGRAEWIANAVKDMLSDDQEFGHPIRVVVPGEVYKSPTSMEHSSPRDLLRTRRSPSATQPGAVPAGSGRRTDLPATLYTSAQTSSEENPVSPKSEASGRPRVTIEVRDGELFMYSRDGGALDEIEDTIRELIRQMPTRTQWTAFYLRAANAAETAEQLGQLLRDEMDPYLGSGSESLAIGQQSVRIIPDSRTNALFISGPESKIKEADKFLELLDTNELPQSLRDRVPRTIPVEHADASQVAGMIRELYKDYMEDPNDRRQERRDDPRDADSQRIRVDVQREGDTPQKLGIRLTLAVDTQASELIVSCNDSLFQQIQELVKSRDQAALDSQPQIQIVILQPETTQSIAESLNSLSGKINVGTSSSSQTNRRSISPSRGSSSSNKVDTRTRNRN